MNQMSSRVMFDMNNRQRNNKNKGKPGLAFAAIALYILSQIAAVGRTEAVILIITIVVSVIVICLAFKKGKKRIAQSTAAPKKKQKEEYCKTCSDEFIYNNRQTEYNEYSAEENFIRDRQRRISQLDDFLKNGLIDKEEYWVLRSHYEK